MPRTATCGVFGADAGSFNPHRNVGRRLTSLSGLSFGTGMHACIGRNLAAGTEPRPDTHPAEHHYGTIPLVLRALLDHDVRIDPERSCTRRHCDGSQDLGLLSSPAQLT